MKKVLLASLFASLIYANGEVYSDIVKPVFADENAKSSIGRLLPTNGVKILEKSGKKLKIQVQGYLNPAAPNVLYYSDKDRIFTLAFAKTANFKTELVKKGENGKWDLVKTSVWVDDGDFYDDVKPLFARAAEIYQNSCGVCHSLHQPNQYNANQWPNLLKSMLSRTAIEKKDEWLITEYLQKHAK
ncbi:cytochrome C [Campylobacter gastrosuis]|uniref:Cytochrome C n=1 Tax=Campylobacter gastrosuis TaxID=2974576 RepID=A0ABT7HQW4_9BACT|nr:cytochrome C [Campylobacter gastrosuis]MDL0089075.1 cytochrome C [Campylobacter gastrosuis]